MSARIESIGLAVPERSLDQETFARWAQEVSKFKGRGERLIPLLFRRAGVERRHSVLLEGDPVSQEFFPPALPSRQAQPEGQTPLQIGGMSYASCSSVRVRDLVAGTITARTATILIAEAAANKPHLGAALPMVPTRL